MGSLELDVWSLQEHSSREDAHLKGRTVDGEKDGGARERMPSRTGREQDLECSSSREDALSKVREGRERMRSRNVIRA